MLTQTHTANPHKHTHTYMHACIPVHTHIYYRERGHRGTTGNLHTERHTYSHTQRNTQVYITNKVTLHTTAQNSTEQRIIVNFSHHNTSYHTHKLHK